MGHNVCITLGIFSNLDFAHFCVYNKQNMSDLLIHNKPENKDLC